jgi:hypothetical protein
MSNAEALDVTDPARRDESVAPIIPSAEPMMSRNCKRDRLAAARLRRATIVRKASDPSAIELHRIAFTRRKTARAVVVVDLVSRSRGSTSDANAAAGSPGAWLLQADAARISKR